MLERQQFGLSLQNSCPLLTKGREENELEGSEQNHSVVIKSLTALTRCHSLYS